MSPLSDRIRKPDYQEIFEHISERSFGQILERIFERILRETTCNAVSLMLYSECCDYKTRILIWCRCLI